MVLELGALSSLGEAIQHGRSVSVWFVAAFAGKIDFMTTELLYPIKMVAIGQSIRKWLIPKPVNHS